MPHYREETMRRVIEFVEELVDHMDKDGKLNEAGDNDTFAIFVIADKNDTSASSAFMNNGVSSVESFLNISLVVAMRLEDMMTQVLMTFAEHDVSLFESFLYSTLDNDAADALEDETDEVKARCCAHRLLQSMVSGEFGNERVIKSRNF